MNDSLPEIGFKYDSPGSSLNQRELQFLPRRNRKDAARRTGSGHNSQAGSNSSRTGSTRSSPQIGTFDVTPKHIRLERKINRLNHELLRDSELGLIAKPEVRVRDSPEVRNSPEVQDSLGEMFDAPTQPTIDYDPDASLTASQVN